MEKIKVDSVAEYKLYQKVIDSTKKIVNIVAIASFILGMATPIVTQLVMMSMMSGVPSLRDNSKDAYLIYVLFLLFFIVLLVIVNKGLDKYKKIE